MTSKPKKSNYKTTDTRLSTSAFFRQLAPDSKLYLPPENAKGGQCNTPVVGDNYKFLKVIVDGKEQTFLINQSTDEVIRRIHLIITKNERMARNELPSQRRELNKTMKMTLKYLEKSFKQAQKINSPFAIPLKKAINELYVAKKNYSNWDFNEQSHDKSPIKEFLQICENRTKIKNKKSERFYKIIANEIKEGFVELNLPALNSEQDDELFFRIKWVIEKHF